MVSFDVPVRFEFTDRVALRESSKVDLVFLESRESRVSCLTREFCIPGVSFVYSVGESFSTNAFVYSVGD